MHVRVRSCGGGGGGDEAVVVVPSRLSRVEELRPFVAEKFNVEPEDQRLFYGGKLLENGYTLHDYGVRLNDVVQLMPALRRSKSPKKSAAAVTTGTTATPDAFNFRIDDLPETASRLYRVGDLVDVRESTGGWVEGKIMKIFKGPPSSASSPDDDDEKSFIFKVGLYDDDADLDVKTERIRPRARHRVDPERLETGQTVMLNHNLEEPDEKGHWYDFTVDLATKLRRNHELIGTLHGENGIDMVDVKVKVQDAIYAIETVVPLKERSEEYEQEMSVETERRNRAINCNSCKDIPTKNCKECGCSVCAGKNEPAKIILCDECNMGFHLFCLNPPLDQLPDDDWYCPGCRRAPNEVIAPGKGKQLHKVNKSKTQKDWGRGMACVGKTQTCTMPANHFGPIPGMEVGMLWRFRIQLSECGVHRPPVSGIHGRDVDGAYSIVLSGGYEDDTDDGFEFTYTGSGGRDLSGNRRTADQSSDQTLTRENRALAKNCALKVINEEGADAGENWKEGKPVRVCRSYKMLKHFPDFAPKEGVRYDGIYKVVKYYPEVGKSGFRVWKYLLRRDDPNPAPWEKNAKKYSMIYPDGYLEAEAEKQALKDKQKGLKRKRVLQESNDDPETPGNDSKKKKAAKEKSDSPPKKRMKTRLSIVNGSPKEASKKNAKTTPKSKFTVKLPEMKTPSASINPFTLAASKKASPTIVLNENVEPEVITVEEKDAIEKDTLNQKLWAECLVDAKSEGKQGLINKVTALFLCIICQEVVTKPITSSCNHNFCINCLKLAFKSTKSKLCPCCRADLSKDELQVNDMLQSALRTIMPGYDGKPK